MAVSAFFSFVFLCLMGEGNASLAFPPLASRWNIERKSYRYEGDRKQQLCMARKLSGARFPLILQ